MCSENFGSKPAAVNAVICGGAYRFTVLTSRLLRLEYSEEGVFEDSATQLAINRLFPPMPFKVLEFDDRMEIITEYLHLRYDKKPFSENGLSVTLNGAFSAYRNVWHYGDKPEGLLGTARTLDEADGAVPLSGGLLSRDGYMLLDDSESMLIDSDGQMSPRRHKYTDLYFFGYGHDYLQCLKDFFTLSGKPPLLPRFALGNWWSRFYPYSESSYAELLDEFEEHGIPLSVAVLDMNWHVTDVPKRYGSGWTGYTWDSALFSDPERFLTYIHGKGLHVTLNVHPADGVRPHEAAYREMAETLDVDPDSETPIPFDASSRAFMEAYLKCLHYPHEAIGVDFWWLDWQQKGGSQMAGYDPLWVLNHSHFYDNAKDGKRPLILSRYAGLGSHRYPVGFSGDSFATWRSLDFQPYFTANASNAGFGWWSHDIGGHMHGERSDEMMVRWVQFGVFSPVMRLHSSDNPFMDKRPWKFEMTAANTIRKFLRLRHKLIPYLYTFNCRCHERLETLIKPMYYRHPEEDAAYGVPNQYYFGDLIACPITVPQDPALRLAAFAAWLPDGLWWDIFNGRAYDGGRCMTLYRGIEEIPVLAKAGAIIPLDFDVKNGEACPETLEIWVFAGDHGIFELLEDDGETEPDFCVTKMEFIWGKTSKLIVTGSKKRNFVVIPIGFADSEEVYRFEAVSGFALELPGTIKKGNTDEEVFALLDRAQIEFDKKTALYRAASGKGLARRVCELHSLEQEQNLLGALLEILTARVVDA